MEMSYSKKSEGIAVVTGPFGEVPIKTATCGHCNGLILVASMGDGIDELGTEGEQLRVDTGGLLLPKKQGSHVCHQCWTIVCDVCHADGRCIPLLKKIEAEEARKVALNSYGT